MQSQIKNIAQKDILRFISERPIIVLRAGKGLGLDFNVLLATQLQARYQSAVGMGRIDSSAINLALEPYRSFYQTWMKKLGLQRQSAVLPGYYVFVNGGIVGYHPGTFEKLEADTKSLAISGIAGLFTGVLVGLIEKSFGKGLEAFVTMIDAPQAMKIFGFIVDVVDNLGTKKNAKRQVEVVKSELEKAYTLLELEPEATDEEVQKARRMMMKKYHPDLHPNEVEKYNRISAEINNAFDFIMKSREKTKVL